MVTVQVQLEVFTRNKNHRMKKQHTLRRDCTVPTCHVYVVYFLLGKMAVLSSAKARIMIQQPSRHLCSSICVYIYCESCVPATAPKHIFSPTIRKRTHSAETQRGNLKDVLCSAEQGSPYITCCKTTHLHFYALFLVWIKQSIVFILR